MNHSPLPAELELGRCLTAEVLVPMKEAFVGKDEIVDLLGVCLVAGENLFLHGPPGTAKSALVQDLARRLDGSVFDYLLTRFTEPNELFGPFDIRKLREGDLVTNTEGMLPEASFVFLDELLNANSAILNSLLMVLNERVFRRGRETRALPLVMVVGASNRLPEDDALGALFDRFLLRVRCDNVPSERLQDVLTAGWKLDLRQHAPATAFRVDDVRRLNSLLAKTDLNPVRQAYVELVHRLRYAGIVVSDRRAVKLQRLMAASALLCGRLDVRVSDLWVLRYIWDTEEQQEILTSLVGDALAKTDGEPQQQRHPRSQGGDAPDAEALARDLERIAERLADGSLAVTQRSYVRDRLGLLAARCQWVPDEQQREHLQLRVDELWEKMGG
ncbi:MAG TPA: AAA family ATPase [Candidatus Anammoximicrobium sp.]|nr:AAA family ATPase [Candidatus Anammoximicrobium sp.]